jgi:hypothetical protein
MRVAVNILPPIVEMEIKTEVEGGDYEHGEDKSESGKSSQGVANR